MKILSVVGARPQFVKLAPVATAAKELGVEHVVVHTGQHYDHGMSQSFFDELQIPAPDNNLRIGSGAHGAQTGAMMAALEPVIADSRPDWVMAYGDTNSTLAAAVVSTKLHVPLAHLEAGLRSFNRRMPEEHNRVLTDHSADVCLAPTDQAFDHLVREGLGERSVVVGDVMVDVLHDVAQRVRQSSLESPVPVEGADYTLATLHRPDNTDDPHRLASIIDALTRLDTQVYLAAHPRLVALAGSAGVSLARENVSVVPPLSYPRLVQALAGAHHVVTDSGGLQKEAYVLGVPTTTVRSETEWVETLADRWNVLCDEPSELADVVTRRRPTSDRGTPYGTGEAARTALEVLIERRIS